MPAQKRYLAVGTMLATPNSLPSATHNSTVISSNGTHDLAAADAAAHVGSYDIVEVVEAYKDMPTDPG